MVKPGSSPSVTSRLRSHLSAHQYAQARNWIERSLGWKEDNPEAHFLMARLHRKRGEREAFQTELAEAERLNYPINLVRGEHWLSLAQGGFLSDVEDRYPLL